MLQDGQSVSVGAGATTNLFLGRPIEFIGVPSVARLLMASDGPLQSVQWLINVGGAQLVPVAAGTTINVASAAGAGPKDDEDQLATNVAIPAGARNQLNVTNGGAGAVITRYRVTILP